MTRIDRRAFVAGLAATPALGLTALAVSSPVHGFLAESGKRGEWPLVIGLIRTGAPDWHEAQIGLLRRQHRYPRALRYMSTDRNKVGFASAVIDYAAAAADLHFVALAAGDPAGRWAELGERREAAHANLYRRLIAAAGREDIVVRLCLRDDGRHGGLRTCLTNDLGLAVTSSPRANLGELAAFLAGCVYGEITGIASPMKRGLTERLRQRIGDPTKFVVLAAAI